MTIAIAIAATATTPGPTSAMGTLKGIGKEVVIEVGKEAGKEILKWTWDMLEERFQDEGRDA